jgi:4-hydroxy-tetrahydrodipicolinate synthase
MKLEGLFTAIITPFKADGSVDKDALRGVIEFQIQNQVDGIVPCTVTGESSTLSHNEHDWVTELAVKYANRRIGVMAATGSNSTQEAIRLSLHAQKVGADAVLLITPYLNMPSQRGLYLHFKAIADTLKIPCFLYNLRAQTNVNIEPNTLRKLTADCPNITGFCEVAENLAQAEEIRAQAHPDFKVFIGRDDQTIDLIRLGGHGLISVAANIVPDKMHHLLRSAFDKDFRAAEDIAKELSDLFELLQYQPSPVPVKTILSHFKICQAAYRLPVCSLEDAAFQAQVQKVLKQLRVSK